MSQSWPPQDSQYPPPRGQQPPTTGNGGYYGGYGTPEQGYGGYAPSSGGRDGWGGQQDSGWAPSNGGWQGTQDEPWPQRNSGQYQPGAPYGPSYGTPYDHPYGTPYDQPYGYGAGYRNAPPLPERARRNWLLPITVLVLCVVLAAAAIGALLIAHGNGSTGNARATVTTSSTTTPGIPAGFKTYIDAATHVRFLLPSSWKTSGSVGASTGLIAFNSDQTNGLVIKQYSFVGDNTAAANGALAGAAGSGTLSNKTGPANVKLAGATWVQEAGDITSGGVTLHMVVLVTTHGQSTYLIGYYAVKSSFDTANRTTFQPIVRSFTFTN
jgi:hypothetical protein